MLGAIELYYARQKGHFFLILAYCSMHYLQKVCPHGKRMNGWCSGGRNSSKQIGHVLDMTWSCSVSSISAPDLGSIIWFFSVKFLGLTYPLVYFYSNLSDIFTNNLSIISYWWPESACLTGLLSWWSLYLSLYPSTMLVIYWLTSYEVGWFCIISSLSMLSSRSRSHLYYYYFSFALISCAVYFILYR